MVILNLSIEEPRNTSSSTNDNHFEASSQSNATLLRDIVNYFYLYMQLYIIIFIYFIYLQSFINFHHTIVFFF